MVDEDTTMGDVDADAGEDGEGAEEGDGGAGDGVGAKAKGGQGQLGGRNTAAEMVRDVFRFVCCCTCGLFFPFGVFAVCGRDVGRGTWDVDVWNVPSAFLALRGWLRQWGRSRALRRTAMSRSLPPGRGDARPGVFWPAPLFPWRVGGGVFLLLFSLSPRGCFVFLGMFLGSFFARGVALGGALFW